MVGDLVNVSGRSPLFGMVNLNHQSTIGRSEYIRFMYARIHAV